MNTHTIYTLTILVVVVGIIVALPLYLPIAVLHAKPESGIAF